MGASIAHLRAYQTHLIPIYSSAEHLIKVYSKCRLRRNWLVRNLALAFQGRRDIYIEKITFIRLYTAHIKKLASAAGPI